MHDCYSNMRCTRCWTSLSHQYMYVIQEIQWEVKSIHGQPAVLQTSGEWATNIRPIRTRPQCAGLPTSTDLIPLNQHQQDGFVADCPGLSDQLKCLSVLYTHPDCPGHWQSMIIMLTAEGQHHVCIVTFPSNDKQSQVSEFVKMFRIRNWHCLLSCSYVNHRYASPFHSARRNTRIFLDWIKVNHQMVVCDCRSTFWSGLISIGS